MPTDGLWKPQRGEDGRHTSQCDFIEHHQQEPFFLYVGTNDVHVPRYPHERFRDKSRLGYRGDAILQFDWTVGDILNALERTRQLENTLIVLTSDNGPIVDVEHPDRVASLRQLLEQEKQKGRKTQGIH